MCHQSNFVCKKVTTNWQAGRRGGSFAAEVEKAAEDIGSLLPNVHATCSQSTSQCIYCIRNQQPRAGWRFPLKRWCPSFLPGIIEQPFSSYRAQY